MALCWEEAHLARRGSGWVRGSVRKSQSRILVPVARGPSGMCEQHGPWEPSALFERALGSLLSRQSWGLTVNERAAQSDWKTGDTQLHQGKVRARNI